MFSQEYNREIGQYFDRRMDLLKARCGELDREDSKLSAEERGLARFGRSLLEQKTEEIYEALGRCGEEEAQALRFLYSAMPLSDLLDYPAAVFMAYAVHGVFLWREGPFAGKVPEKIFANYVLHHRVHNEDITDTRRFFYEMLKERTAGRSMYDAAVEANFWCGENATYQSTFMRTQNPVTMYGTAAGRCGEEAPFAVTALRCLGIPAREVAAPFWAHCDDNHAWVEAWCDGKWHFLGGCEPAETLDEGWFAGPASRAMLIDSVWFGQDAPCEQTVGRLGMATRVNHLPLYAHTAKLTVRVEDEQGKPVPGARVDFTVLNFSRFNSVATLYTGAEENSAAYGAVSLAVGCGDMLVSASAGECYGETLVSMADVTAEKDGQAEPGECAKEYTIILKKEMQDLGVWRELDLRAPAEILRSEYKTDEQAAAESARLEYAAKCRQQKIADFYPQREAERVLLRFAGEEREAIRDILCQACANAGEIIRFLEWDFAGQTVELDRVFGGEHWKAEALKALKKNDYWDIKSEVLAECSILASPYAADFPQDVFFRDLLCPCVSFEMARSGRAALAKAFAGLQSRIREDPRRLPAMLDAWMVSLPEEEYANLVTSPVGCLTGGIASPHSRMLLCANIFRALGIPARIRMMDRTLEYYENGAFRPLGQPAFGEPAARGGQNASKAETPSKAGKPGKGKIAVRMEAPLKPEDWRHYSLSRFQEGRFVPLFIRPEAETGPVEFELEQGIYRIVTTNRLPNGGQFVKVYDFRLRENEEKPVCLSMREIPVEAIVSRMSVKDIPLQTPEGEEKTLSDLSGKGRALFLWLEPGKEPTEHIINELCEKSERLRGSGAPVYCVVRKGPDYAGDATLQKVCGAIPQARVLLDDFGENYKEFSFQVGRNPGKFPLAVIMEDGKEAIYSDSGYNVGMSDPLLRILAQER